MAAKAAPQEWLGLVEERRVCQACQEWAAASLVVECQDCPVWAMEPKAECLDCRDSASGGDSDDSSGGGGLPGPPGLGSESEGVGSGGLPGMPDRGGMPGI